MGNRLTRRHMQQLEERNTYTPTDIPHVSGNCDPILTREETLSVLGLKTFSNISDAALTGSKYQDGTCEFPSVNLPLLTKSSISGIVKPERLSSPTSKVGVSKPERNR